VVDVLGRTATPRVHRFEGWQHFRQSRATIERAFAAAPDIGLQWLPIGVSVDV